MKNKLEVAANLVFIVVAFVLVFVLLKNHLGTGGNSSFAKEGDTLAALPNYDWQAHDRTLLLALKKGCRYCEDSAPFYRKLRELERENQLSAHLIAVLPDDSTAAAEMLQSKRLEIDLRAGVSLSDLKIFATPTLVLVGSNGRVLHVWQGQLSASEEEHVIEMVRAVSTSKSLADGLVDYSRRVSPSPPTH